ncbi:MAG: cytochrome c1 [Burkholderiaceae bacterium]|nr:cytochrome c1 [Burkholderiaceae bacterium]
MNSIKKLLAGLTLGAALLGGASVATAAEIHFDHAPINLNDQASLQRGAKIFVNYCLGCHSAAFMRYNRLQDLGLTEQQIKDNLLFTDHKVGETMISAIDPVQAKAWFGVAPPDLTVIARSRAGEGYSGADYLYTLLRSFYRDETRPTGWNNLVFNNIGMPFPLWELQGQRKPVFKTETVYGQAEQVPTGQWEQLTQGTVTPEQFDRDVADLVNYLQWMGEPAQQTRERIGIWVLLFLVICTVIAWRLNKAYWKDVQ